MLLLVFVPLGLFAGLGSGLEVLGACKTLGVCLQGDQLIGSPMIHLKNIAIGSRVILPKPSKTILLSYLEYQQGCEKQGYSRCPSSFGDTKRTRKKHILSHTLPGRKILSSRTGGFSSQTANAENRPKTGSRRAERKNTPRRRAQNVWS